MRTILRLPGGLFEELSAELLDTNSRTEQAAFLFLENDEFEDRRNLNFVEYEKIQPLDFACQEPDYLELTSEAKARLIKRAHDLRACLAEIHSHIGPWPAEFSEADRLGLKETVPHIFWRLPDRPYVAIVVAHTGFDALVWRDSPSQPQPVSAILSGDRLLHPTGRSLEKW